MYRYRGQSVSCVSLQICVKRSFICWRDSRWSGADQRAIKHKMHSWPKRANVRGKYRSFVSLWICVKRSLICLVGYQPVRGMYVLCFMPLGLMFCMQYPVYHACIFAYFPTPKLPNSQTPILFSLSYCILKKSGGKSEKNRTSVCNSHMYHI